MNGIGSATAVGDLCPQRQISPDAPTVTGQNPRVRLKPWLLAQVDSGRFAHLAWLDPDRRLFRIPWEHATRAARPAHGEYTIFKAWALETGKFREGVDEPEPAKWKANLRCALNKSREFELRFDGTKATPLQPYKIYQVVNADAANNDEVWRCRKTTVCSDFADATFLFQMPNLTQLTIDPDAPAVVGPTLEDPEQLGAVAGTPELRLRDPQTLDPISLDHLGASAVMQAQADPADLLGAIPSTDLDLKFQYRGRPVGSVTVSDPRGCRLFYGQLWPDPRQVDLFGPVDLQQVPFPDPAEIPGRKQRAFTQALLNVMDRGLVLEIWEQDVYAVRLCQCKVFWSGPGFPHLGRPNQLERERRVKIFSLSDFLQGLISYQKGEAPNVPPHEMIFCFGEDWPDAKPKEKKLIVVQVIPVVARILTEMFSGEHSWSIDSIRLQISNPNLKDQTVEHFKEIQRLLQSQNLQGS
ncbi:interferon regulatory factor 5 [Stigmatopora nigra]